MSRERIRLPFGEGVDRFTGQTVVQAGTFRDIRNAYLYDGRLEIAKGLSRISTLTTGHQIIAIHPARSRAKGVLVTITAGTGPFADYAYAHLWVCDPDGTDAVLKGSMMLFTPEAARRVTVADSYDRVFVAHDEPDLQYRYPTAIYNFGTNSFETFGNGFFTDEAMTVPYAPAFRGVYTHLNYLVGWGYGTPADPIRPETLWISLPGLPVVFDQQHYFLAGIRGDAIIGCASIGEGLMVRKGTESYLLTGYDRATFGLRPADREFGQSSAKLGVVVGGISYFWSASGPRRSAGGQSEDLGLALDLLGPAPDALAASIDTDAGFATYDPTRREVQFTFGRWAFVYHLAAAPPRWSYRKYPVAIQAAGVLYESTVTAFADPPDQEIEFDAMTPIGAKTQSTIEMSVDIAGGTANALDRYELWGKQACALPALGDLSGYRRLNSSLISAATDITFTSSAIYPACPIDLALRVKRLGAAGPLYISNDPLDWPADARRAAESVPLNAPVHSSHVWAANGGAADTLTINCTTQFTSPQGDATALAYIVYEVEVSDGGGGWTAAPITAEPSGTANGHMVVADVTAFAGLTRDVRMRHHTTYLDSSWTTIAGVVFA